LARLQLKIWGLPPGVLSGSATAYGYAEAVAYQPNHGGKNDHDDQRRDASCPASRCNANATYQASSDCPDCPADNRPELFRVLFCELKHLQ
jgi:hypothetical protein